MTLSAAADVSRETQKKIERYCQYLSQWNGRINLVGKNDISDLGSRHVEDCYGLARLLPSGAHRCADFGSGGGLPGILIAIARPDIEMILVESDVRKGAFLRMLCRELHLNATVLSSRIESTNPLQPDTIVARALAPLTVLVQYMEYHQKVESRGFFMKGRSHLDEVYAAKKDWTFVYDIHGDKSEKGSAVVEVSDLRRVSDGE